MDDLKIIILRQNEVLKKLETALSNVINRIESIEKIFYNTERNKWSDNLSPILPKKTKYGLLESNPHKSEDLNKEIGDFDLSAINSAFNLIPIDVLKIDYMNQPLNLIEDNNDIDSHHIRDIHINNKFLGLFNSKLYNSASNKYSDHYQQPEELSEDKLENKSIRTNLKLPAFESENKLENFECEIFQKNNENDFCATNNISKLQIRSLWKNEFKSNQKSQSKETPKVISNRLDMLNKCYNYNKSAILSNCIGKSALNTGLSNQLYIFDEEDNSSMRHDDPLDLEIAENEFYYLKTHIKRGSTTTRDHSQSSGLDNCHLFKCLYPTAREIKQGSDNIHNFGICLNNKQIQMESNRYSIKEIKYHKPFEKIIGYVQIPYSAFLSQSFEVSDKDKTMKIMNSLEEVNYLESASIYNETKNCFKANIFASNNDHYDGKFTYIKGSYPIFYQFFSFQRYPILFLRPLFSN
ncbi:uncharacterized protein cubi_00214 [Cryptosporidium ubiquitum]|uniref:Uncharacterized protein n=1 Tax=Cryptosporidium ubiquitum TaxID=857276 RepID=A0A1J4MP55_9CRYT|nr:uncharacterized protein cubi_00214 [Cryptosporidium ubiquitum]OII74661.1 hypothetical protein cubi_00214 [Cryptosporidium ubiquitum]